MKFVISGILIACIGLLLSYTYRPYVYENHINDFHLADVIGSIVCVPDQVESDRLCKKKHAGEV